MPYLFFAFVFLCFTVYSYKNPDLDLSRGFKKPVRLKLLKKYKQEDIQRRVTLLGAIAGLIFFLITKNITVMFVCILGAFFGFRFIQNKREQERIRLLKKSLQGAVGLLWIPCDAGLSFKEAVKKLSSETDNPVIQEIDKCYMEISAGKRREAAYRDLVKRTIPETESLMRAVAYNEGMGEPISGFLRRESKRMQMEKRAKIQEIGDKISSKVLFVVIGIMGPAFIILLFGPIAGKFQILNSLRF